MAVNREELIALLSDKTDPRIRLKAWRMISNLNADSRISLLTNNDGAGLRLLLDVFACSQNDEEIESILKLLVNIVDPGSLLTAKLVTDEMFIRRLVTDSLFKEKAGVRKKTAAAMLLSNLTIGTNECEAFLSHMRKEDNGLINFLDAIVGGIAEGRKSEELGWWCYVAYVLRNITRSADICQILATGSTTGTKEQSPSKCPLLFLLPVLMRSDGTDKMRLAVADVIRNCCFHTGLHNVLISLGNDDLLSALLYPLLGNEQLTEDENDSLPIDLQYAELEKQRERCAIIRIKLLETIYQLCATSRVREYLRKKGVYYVLREYHKWEQNNPRSSEIHEAETLCVNVIGVLIRTEDEVGCDDLTTIEKATAD